MIEVIKTILMAAGIVQIFFTLAYFAIKCEEKFKSWRRNGCKIKCLCKHVYDVEFIDTLHRDALLICSKCGKKKRIKNLSRETVDILLRGEKYGTDAPQDEASARLYMQEREEK